MQFLNLDTSAADIARFAIVPVPYDGTCLESPGARRGPEAILRASRLLERFDEELAMEPWRVGIHTLGQIAPGVAAPERMHDLIKRTVGDVLARDRTPILLGGEHSITAAAVEACAEKTTPRLTILHIDAHADLREQHQGTPFSHACTMRRLSERFQIVNVGLRALAPEEPPILSRENVNAFPMHVLRRRAFAESLGEIAEAVRRHVYISIDLDGLDPSIMPAVARPEPGGLLWWELMAILRTVISRSTVVGADVVNLIPLPGVIAPDLLAARLVYKIIGYVAKAQAHWRPDTGETPTVAMPRV